MKPLLSLLILPFLTACDTQNGASLVEQNPVALRSDLHFLPAKAEKGSLFRYYQPKGKSKWLDNWTRPLDLTGVSWNDSRTATLISRSHVVMAAHFIRPSDVPVMFHDKNGKPHERYITAVRKLDAVGDIAVARLNLPLPPEIKSYRFASPGRAKVGAPVIVTDQTRTVSVHRIAAVSGPVVQLRHVPELNPVYTRNLVVGDSGNPSFLLENGELTLLETHTYGGPGSGPFYGDPQVRSAVIAAMDALGD